MAGSPAFAQSLLRPAPMSARPRWLHWLAWLASIVSFVFLAVPVLGGRPDIGRTWIAQADAWICLAFALEFFTRSGFKTDGWQYAKWRWFDFLAMLPVLLIQQFVGVQEWIVWLVLFARLGRMVDRTLGDGFVKRHLLALTGAIEEEISDRVLLKIMGRIEGELAQANFGATAAASLAKHKESILQRIYEEQRPETGALAKLANMTGIVTAVERMEARVFDAILKVVGSEETDAMIREIVKQSLAHARTEIGERSWKQQIGLRPAEAGPGTG